MAGTSDAREAVPMGPLQSGSRPPFAAIGQDHSSLHRMKRTSRVRNRMHESRTSGSVGAMGQHPRLPGTLWVVSTGRTALQNLAGSDVVDGPDSAVSLWSRCTPALPAPPDGECIAPTKITPIEDKGDCTPEQLEGYGSK
jgi:hypothetical protein